jgi:hypothetical protein
VELLRPYRRNWLLLRLSTGGYFVTDGENEEEDNDERMLCSAWNTIIKLKVPEIPRGIPSEKLP